MSLHSFARLVAVLLTASLLAVGCGGNGAPSVEEAQSCLREIEGLTVEQAPPGQNGVDEGVMAMQLDVEKPENILLAAAAVASSEKDVDQFRKDVEESGKGAGPQAQIESGSSGRYVWVVVGSKESESFERALKCIRP